MHVNKRVNLPLAELTTTISPMAKALVFVVIIVVDVIVTRNKSILANPKVS